MNNLLLKTLRQVARLNAELPYAQFNRPEPMPRSSGPCLVHSCSSDFVTAGGSSGDRYLCPEHYPAASQDSRRKHTRAFFWQAAIQNCFADLSIYDRIVASGRYLKLSTMAEDAGRRVDQAWRVVALEAKFATENKPPNPERRH